MRSEGRKRQEEKGLGPGAGTKGGLSTSDNY